MAETLTALFTSGSSATAGTTAATTSATAASTTAATAGATAGTAGTAAAGTGAAAAGTGAATTGAAATTAAETGGFWSTMSDISSVASGISAIGSGISSRRAAKFQGKEAIIQGMLAKSKATQEANAIREQTIQNLAAANAARVGTASAKEAMLSYGARNMRRYETIGTLSQLQSLSQAQQLKSSGELSLLSGFTKGLSLISGGLDDESNIRRTR